MNLLERLKKREGYNINECAICDYVLEHCEEVVHLSSRELGRRTYTSSTVVVRFCQKLGYPSYNDFKLKFILDLRTDNKDIFLEKEEHLVSIINKVATKQQQTVKEMNASISFENLERLRQHLCDVNYIDIIALDNNIAIAEYARHNFFSAGKIANVYSSYHLQYMLSQLVKTEKHIVFLISKSGSTKAINEIAQELHAHHIYTIAITADEKNPLAKLCSMSFPCLFQDDFHSLQDMIFFESAIYLFNTFSAMLISGDYDKTTSLKEKYNEGYNKSHPSL